MLDIKRRLINKLDLAEDVTTAIQENNMGLLANFVENTKRLYQYNIVEFTCEFTQDPVDEFYLTAQDINDITSVESNATIDISVGEITVARHQIADSTIYADRPEITSSTTLITPNHGIFVVSTNEILREVLNEYLAEFLLENRQSLYFNGYYEPYDGGEGTYTLVDGAGQDIGLTLNPNGYTELALLEDLETADEGDDTTITDMTQDDPIEQRTQEDGKHYLNNKVSLAYQRDTINYVAPDWYGITEETNERNIKLLASILLRTHIHCIKPRNYTIVLDGTYTIYLNSQALSWIGNGATINFIVTDGDYTNGLVNFIIADTMNYIEIKKFNFTYTDARTDKTQELKWWVFDDTKVNYILLDYLNNYNPARTPEYTVATTLGGVTLRGQVDTTKHLDLQEQYTADNALINYKTALARVGDTSNLITLNTAQIITGTNEFTKDVIIPTNKIGEDYAVDRATTYQLALDHQNLANLDVYKDIPIESVTPWTTAVNDLYYEIYTMIPDDKNPSNPNNLYTGTTWELQSTTLVTGYVDTYVRTWKRTK